MSNLAQAIEHTVVGEGCLAVFWLCQAGFVFKTSSGKSVYVDPYFSDAVERVHGLKRMMACPISPEEVTADLILCTHEHLDHLDTDALPSLSCNACVQFAGPLECYRQFRSAGIPEERCHLLEEGREITVEGIRVTGVYADHGDLAPDAIGAVFDLDGVRVYHTGDTAYRPEKLGPVIKMRPDIVIPCINGRYGNLDANEAALLVRDVNPQLAIASHFWMFVEHNGDPALFLECCSRVAPSLRAVVMKPGELLLFQSQKEPEAVPSGWGA
jgi:L-ascorbate 6-phosphate lactonase